MIKKFNLPLLLDGSTGAMLIKAGMPFGKCSEEWILNNPTLITELQQAYVSAGSNAVMAPTFETNRLKLASFGLGDKVLNFNKRLVALSRQAVGKEVLVAGNMSSLGLFVEPFGETTFDELYEIYREQASALKQAGVDYIAIETIMSLTEARAALLAAKETGLPVTVTMTVDKKGKTLSGGDVTACLIILEAMGADAVGLNCSTGPDIVYEALKAASPYLHIPLVAKPNAGLPDANKSGVYDITPEDFAQYVSKFLAIGVGFLGGCCGSTPEHISAMHTALKKSDYCPLTGDDGTKTQGVREFLVADERHTYLINEESIDFLHKISCGPDFADELIALADEGFMVARILLTNIEDAREFGMSAYLSTLPVVLFSQEIDALEMALRLYQGRALIDSKAGLPQEQMELMAARYGAVIV